MAVVSLSLFKLSNLAISVSLMPRTRAPVAFLMLLTPQRRTTRGDTGSYTLWTRRLDLGCRVFVRFGTDHQHRDIRMSRHPLGNAAYKEPRKRRMSARADDD